MASMAKRAQDTSEFGFYAVPESVVDEARMKGKIPTTVSVARKAAAAADAEPKVSGGRGDGVALCSFLRDSATKKNVQFTPAMRTPFVSRAPRRHQRAPKRRYARLVLHSSGDGPPGSTLNRLFSFFRRATRASAAPVT